MLFDMVDKVEGEQLKLSKVYMQTLNFLNNSSGNIRPLTRTIAAQCKDQVGAQKLLREAHAGSVLGTSETHAMLLVIRLCNTRHDTIQLTLMHGEVQFSSVQFRVDVGW